MKPLLILVAMLATAPARAEPLASVGILQGTAVLVRQTTRYVLEEGAALGEGDIVETPSGAFVQIEFGDGAVAALGEDSKLILKPRLTALKTTASPMLYLLEGWLKVNLAATRSSPFAVLGPRYELAVASGAVVARNEPGAFALFVERGAARLSQRDGAHATLALKEGDFAMQTASADKPSVATRMSPEFRQTLPRLFRDQLPARATALAKRNPTLKPIGPIGYADVKAWLRSEPGVRLALSRQWRGRASDRAFRDDVAANLSAHMEWERVIYPERFLPKKPPPPRAAAPAPPASGPASQPP